MTLQQRKVLKLIYQLTNYSEQLFYYDEMQHFLCLYDSPNESVDCSMYASQMQILLKHLQEIQYIEKMPSPSFGIDIENFRLTYKGLHRLHFSFEIMANFLIKSVAIPIIVSIVTTLLVTLISKW